MDIKRKRIKVKSSFNSSVNLETVATESKPWSWTEKVQRPRRDDMQAVFDELKPYWPVTLRQAYYRLISSPMISQEHWNQHGNPDKPRVDVYAAMGRVLTWMRIEDFLPWNAITDETRILTPKVGYDSAEEFIFGCIDFMRRGYRRCLASDQPYHIELWLEKESLLRLVEPIASEYCRQVLCCRGYDSVTFKADFYLRMEEAKARGLEPVVLYFGDWDPSGCNMLPAAIRFLKEELGLTGVNYKRCGINPEHFSGLQAGDPVPLKTKDPRAKKFLAEHGRMCYELDAFHPVELQNLVRESIQDFTDLEKVSCNLERQADDKDSIDYVRGELMTRAAELLEG